MMILTEHPFRNVVHSLYVVKNYQVFFFLLLISFQKLSCILYLFKINTTKKNGQELTPNSSPVLLNIVES